MGSHLNLDSMLTTETPPTPKELHQRAEQGVASEEVKELIQKFHLNQKQMAFLLNVSDKTLYALLKSKQLDMAHSDRFLMIQSVFQEGAEAFMSVETFRNWLDKPHFYFDKKTPFELLGTINGAEAVRSELIRTKYGILS